MKLTLKNIGKFRNAEIEINGITVIAGENNTGKSTIGKVLFTIFNSFYNLEEKIKQEQLESIERFISRQNIDRNSNIYQDNYIDEILLEIDKKDLNVNSIKNILLKDLNLEINDEIYRIVDNISNKIINTLEINKDVFISRIFEKYLYTEFDGSICNIHSKDSNIKLRIKDKEMSFNLVNSEVLNFENPIYFNTDSVYIDNPFILDEIRQRRILFRINRNIAKDHKTDLAKKLDSDYYNIIDEIDINDSFEKIFNKILLGNIVKVGPRKKYKDRDGNIFSLENVSTGIKSFIIIKTLLFNGVLGDNGTIILDEPEIHLHPEWQLVFAELIVLLQKEFNLHILLTTHSPYFVKAIEVYSNKYGISDKCKYYLSENVLENESKIDDVSMELERIYAKLANPFQVLEDEKYSS